MMGFFRKVGNFVGTAAGVVVGGAVTVVGEVTDSDFIKEIGEGVYKTSVAAGNLVGQAADGAAGVVGGVISQDQSTVNKGIGELGNATGKVIVGAISGVGNIAKNTIDVVEGVIEGDDQKVLQAGKTLVKVAAVSALAIGVGDYLDIIGTDGAHGIEVADYDVDLDLDDMNLDIADMDMQDMDLDIDELHDVGGEHFVEPHHVNAYTRSDGTFVEGYWRDGDGNTAVNLSVSDGGGYIRSNL